MAGDIQIDQSEFDGFIMRYGPLVEDVKKRATSTYPWKPGNNGVEMNLGVPFTTRLGSSSFAVGSNLTNALNRVRENVLGRMKLVYTDTYNIHAGITNLKKETSYVEEFNKMTAEKFADFIPRSTPAIDSGSSSGSASSGQGGS